MPDGTASSELVRFAERVEQACSYRRRTRSSPTAPARCTGRRKACWSSPTCISKKARASPPAACCCRPTTPRRRWRGSARWSRAMRRASWSRSATASTTAAGRSACSADDRAMLAALQRGRDWIWIAGNHDPEPVDGLGGISAATLAIGPLIFRHAPERERSRRRDRRPPASGGAGERARPHASAAAASPPTASAW